MAKFYKIITVVVLLIILYLIVKDCNNKIENLTGDKALRYGDVSDYIDNDNNLSLDRQNSNCIKNLSEKFRRGDYTEHSGFYI